jgi:hypothetical protein
MDAPNEFQPLMDDIFRRKVLRAREQKRKGQVPSGFDLFKDSVSRIRAGVRSDFPQFSDEQINAEVRRRLRRVKQVQEHGFYQAEPLV